MTSGDVDDGRKSGEDGYLGEITKQKTITLWFPRVELTGGSAAGDDLDITGWRGSIAMYVEANGVAEETSLEIGFLVLRRRAGHHR